MSQEWECQICGHVYDEARGSPRDRIARGTKFEDIPDDWVCPDCQVGKEHFSPRAGHAAMGGEAA